MIIADESCQRGRGTLRFLVTLAILGSACSAKSPDHKYYDLGGVQDVYLTPDFPSYCPDQPTLQAPILDPYPNPTSYDLQTFRGVAPQAAQLLARVGASTMPVVDVGDDGAFCVEVQLIPDSNNAVVLTPLDENGCPGQQTTISITHQTSQGQDAGATQVQNLAVNASITAQADPQSGGILENVNDGDPSSYAVFSFPDGLDDECEADDFFWIRVDLGKNYTISKFRLLWGPSVGDQYARCYLLMLSKEETVSNPDPTPGSGWTIPSKGTVTSASAEDQEISISPVEARWAAVLLQENGGTGLSETFKLAEFEVWGQDPNATPPPPPDRCE